MGLGLCELRASWVSSFAGLGHGFKDLRVEGFVGRALWFRV